MASGHGGSPPPLSQRGRDRGGGRGIALRVEGADAVAVDGAALRLSTGAGDLALPLLLAEEASGPASVQPRGGQAFEVTAPFAPARPNRQSATPGTAGRAVDNPQSPTDGPADLLYSAFLGGSAADYGMDIVSPKDNAFLTGYTASTNFPTTTGTFDISYNGGYDAFVVKVNATGRLLTLATFLGGSGDDYGNGIAVDLTGSTYVTGRTASSNFPTTAGAFDTSHNGGDDAFAVKLSPDGTALAYATYLGGSAADEGVDIALDAAYSACVTGHTTSINFPVTAGAFDTTYYGGDAFVVKLNPAGSGLTYSTFLGGNDDDQGYDIALDAAGSVYVTGYTKSSNFPTTAGAFDTSYNGRDDVFAVKLNPAGSALAYATFLGSATYDRGYGIAVDTAGSAYLTGYTYSSNFPTTPGAFDTSFNGSIDAFAVKLNPAGSALTYATYLGGSNSDDGFGIAVDTAGSAYVTGDTASSNFPTIVGCLRHQPQRR